MKTLLLVFECNEVVEINDGNKFPVDHNLTSLLIMVIGPIVGFNHTHVWYMACVPTLVCTGLYPVTAI